MNDNAVNDALRDRLRVEADWLKSCAMQHPPGELQDEWLRRKSLIDDAIAALASRAAPLGEGDARLAEIGELIRTQDNRITADPIFVVEQRRSYVTDPDYNDARTIWIDDEGVAVEPGSAGARKVAVHDVWEFVTACFTEQGCKDYLRVNGHNLKETRIYAHSGWRNREWIDIRRALSALTPQERQEAQGAER